MVNFNNRLINFNTQIQFYSMDTSCRFFRFSSFVTSWAKLKTVFVYITVLYLQHVQLEFRTQCYVSSSLTFWPKNWRAHDCIKMHQCWKFGEIQSGYFYNKANKCIFQHASPTVTLNFDLLTQNMSNVFQDSVNNNARTDSRAARKQCLWLQYVGRSIIKTSYLLSTDTFAISDWHVYDLPLLFTQSIRIFLLW